MGSLSDVMVTHLASNSAGRACERRDTYGPLTVAGTALKVPVILEGRQGLRKEVVELKKEVMEHSFVSLQI